MDDLLSKLTIIIITYNRQPYAIRNMQFWSNKSAKVIVIDGSDDPLNSQILSTLNSNIAYIHKVAPFNERVLLSTELITTPYAMLCCDDDFMVPSGIIECIKFLERNSDYSVCNGRIMGFEPKEDGLRIWPEKAHHQNHIVNQNSFNERIKYHLENFNITTIYGVHRRESLIYCFKFSSNYRYSSPYVWETLFELLSARFGKSSVLPFPTRLNSQENVPISNDDWNRNVYISDWYDDSSNAEEVLIYYDNALSALNSLDNNADKKINERIILMATEVRMDISRRHKERMLMVSKTNSIGWLRGTGLFRMFRLLYRLMLFKGTDYKDDYFYSKSKYKFNQLKVEHGIKISSSVEKELKEIFNTVLDFRAGRSLPAGS